MMYRCEHLRTRPRALGLMSFRQIMHLFSFLFRQESLVASSLWKHLLVFESLGCHFVPSEFLSQLFPSLLSLRVSCVLCSATRRKFDISLSEPENGYSCPLPTPFILPCYLCNEPGIWEELGVRSRHWSAAYGCSLRSFWIQVFWEETHRTWNGLMSPV